MLVKQKSTHLNMRALYLVLSYVAPEICENAPDARHDEHVSPNRTSVREASARRSNDADGVLSQIEVLV